MTKREYLRSVGFNVGERGRFTDAMLTALKEFEGNFDSPTSSKPQHAVAYEDLSQEMVRASRVLKGYTSEGYEVGFITCRSCSQHMIYCDCVDGILAPSIVITSKEPDVRVA